MLRATIEIVPFGIEPSRRAIGTIEIANISRRTGKTAYSAKLVHHETGEEREAILTGHRRGDMGAYDLVHRAVTAFGLNQTEE